MGRSKDKVGEKERTKCFCALTLVFLESSVSTWAMRRCVACVVSRDSTKNLGRWRIPPQLIFYQWENRRRDLRQLAQVTDGVAAVGRVLGCPLGLFLCSICLLHIRGNCAY